MTQNITDSMLPERHPNHDFFIADIFDNTPFKDDIASMGNPIYTLSLKRDFRQIDYVKDNISVTIAPSTHGLPTILDKDILLYCGSLLMAEVNKGRIPEQTLRISAHDLLVTTNRHTNGEGYKLLEKALNRLAGVFISTNIKTNNIEQKEGFHLIERWKIIESSRVKDRMIRLEITLSEWFYNSIIGKEILSINRDYFKLKKPLERRLYEIARKHCGKQHSWSIRLDTLMQKTGSTGMLRRFRFNIKKMITTNHLPDYILAVEDDIVTFINRKEIPALPLSDDIPAISIITIEKAKNIVVTAGTGWDFNTLHAEFSDQILSGKFTPTNINGAFINFVKKKVKEYA